MVYAVVIGKFVYKELTNEKIVEALRQTVADTGMIMLIIICSAIFGYVIIYNQAPQAIAAFLVTLTENPVALMFIIMAFLLVAGMFMEPTVNTLLLTPIFLPVAMKLGISPVHFGIIITFNLCIGIATPPVGSTLFVAARVAKVPLSQLTLPLLPMFALEILALFLVTYIPALSLWLPQVVLGKVR